VSVSNVTPRPKIATNPRGRQILLALLAVLVIIGLFKAFGPHENKYETLARDVTLALQNNDVDGVKKLQNAETATTINRGIVGRAADRLAPLGKLKSVKEVTAKDAPERTHEFDLAFDKGTIHERIKVDPDFKIVHFQYTKVQT
jgi:hypothetical protein